MRPVSRPSAVPPPPARIEYRISCKPPQSTSRWRRFRYLRLRSWLLARS
jgi:hypothetical protein